MCDIRLPHCDELEKLVLGLCMMSAKAFALASDLIAPSDFYSPKNSLIHITLQEMAGNGEPIDLPLFCFFAARKGKLEECGGVVYISSLVDGLPRCEQKNLIYYCHKLRLLTFRREITKRCHRVTTVNDEIDPDEELILLRDEIERYLDFKKEAKNGRRAHNAGTSL
jgi:replicative DNA helicase